MLEPNPGAPAAGDTGAEATLAEAYRRVRDATEVLSAPLTDEDMVVQSMPDVSPTKWHLAHTSWFFENFVLMPAGGGYEAFHPEFGYLFNSYYQTVGEMHARPRRGLLTRPTRADVAAYRRHVDDAVAAACERGLSEDLQAVLRLGLHHEQQHQELILTDILHVFSCNPLLPAYRCTAAGRAPAEGHAPAEGRAPAEAPPEPRPPEWIGLEEGAYEIGHAGPEFAFDNEGPRHKVYLRAFRLASRPVTAGEFRRFLEDGGYERPELWLSDGWETVQREGWRSPLYWSRTGRDWQQFTLNGLQPLDESEPVRHVSYYEADAYARWAGARLPTEAEWEVAMTAAAEMGESLGSVWEWTASAYAPYPRYRPPRGAVGEYNGKFMCNQIVLRGRSAVTPLGHARLTYRNFFYPHQRWQFSGLRLARDA